MTDTRKPVEVEYFSDVLCVWAYGAQARVDALKREFASEVALNYRFIPLFAAAREKVLRNWGPAENGFENFNRKLREIVSGWEHVRVHEDLWLTVRPASSTPAHLFLKAIDLLERNGALSSPSVSEFNGRNYFEEAMWRVREGFFLHARDVSRKAELVRIAASLDLPLAQIEELIDNGDAHAALQLDRDAQERYHVAGSPPFVLDEGRQHLYGNVGFRVIEANVRELLRDPQYGEASWC